MSHGEIGNDMIAFARFAIEAYGLKVAENHPVSWNKMIENYRRENYVRRAGMIWINYTISNFFNEDPDIIRGDCQEDSVVYTRFCSMYFMEFYNHKRKDVAIFYGKSVCSVGYGIRQIQGVLNDKDKFQERKILQILKYQIL